MLFPLIGCGAFGESTLPFEHKVPDTNGTNLRGISLHTPRWPERSLEISNYIP